MQSIEFKDFVNYENRLGKIIIAGVEGSGKTTLLTALSVGKMLHGQKDCWKSYEIVDDYNLLGFNFSKNYEHLAFSNIDMNCSGTTIPERLVYKCNPYKLGLFNMEYMTDFFPPYSAFFLTEAYNFLSSYLYNKFRPEFKGFLKTCRQAKYDMVVDTHSFLDICTIFRRLTNRFIYLFDKIEDVKNSEGLIIGHKLYIWEWNNNRDVELWERTSKRENCKEYVLYLNKCYHKNFDTEFCRFLHLEGRENQDFEISKFPEIISIGDIQNIGENFGIIATPGFFNEKIKQPKVTENKEENELFSEKIEDDFEF